MALRKRTDWEQKLQVSIRIMAMCFVNDSAAVYESQKKFAMSIFLPKCGPISSANLTAFGPIRHL
jgi:hypothetical protein